MELLNDKIVPALYEIRKYQGPNGEVKRNYEKARELLLKVVAETETIYNSLNLPKVWNALKMTYVIGSKEDSINLLILIKR